MIVSTNSIFRVRCRICAVLAAVLISGGVQAASATPVLSWYVFDEPSGAFAEVARCCAEESDGAYRIELKPLPTDADQQREQLVRRLAARDSDIDIIGMDVIWTAEFAQAGWILPWPQDAARQVEMGRIDAVVRSAVYEGRLWAAPFTTNTQLLWYRTDRVPQPPRTWDEMIDMAEKLGEDGTIQAQGERYEGLNHYALKVHRLLLD